MQKWDKRHNLSHFYLARAYSFTTFAAELIQLNNMEMTENANMMPTTYIKSPFDLLKAPMDWSIMESKILLSVLSVIQDRFNKMSGKELGGQLMLFADDEFDDKGEVEICVDIKDIGVGSNHYDKLRDACKRMSSIIIPVQELSKEGRLIEVFRPAFSVGIPVEINNSEKFEENRRNEDMLRMKKEMNFEIDENDIVKRSWKRGQRNKKIIFKINRSVADMYFRGGNYSLHLRNIAHMSKCSYTPHIYMYLSKFREFLKETTLSYEELRRMTGMYRYNENGELVNGRGMPCKEGLYPRYKDFNKRVLQPVKEELDALYKAGDTDLTFRYEPMDKYGNVVMMNEDGEKSDKAGKRVKVHKIHFTVISRSSKERDMILDGMSLEEKMQIGCVENEEQARWMEFSRMADAYCHEWWSVFGEDCSSCGVEDGVLTFRVPNTFTIEKWNEHAAFIMKEVMEIWGAKSARYMVGS